MRTTTEKGSEYCLLSRASTVRTARSRLSSWPARLEHGAATSPGSLVTLTRTLTRFLSTFKLIFSHELSV